jgi:type IV pilus assembly protein PilE
MQSKYGFTLIEVMIVVAIVAILATIAYPSYQDSIRKTRRADAKEALMRIAAAQERYFFTHNAYTKDSTLLGIVGNKSQDNHYVIKVVGKDEDNMVCESGANKFPCFTATATATGAQIADEVCEQFSITHTGAKTASKHGGGNTTDTCWK